MVPAFVKRGWSRLLVVAVAAVTLASTGIVATASSGASRPVPHATGRQPYTVDDSGEVLPAPARNIAERILAAARHHSVVGIDALMHGWSAANITVQNNVLKEPGVFAEIVKVLTVTHGAPTDGETWPGFTMTEGEGMFDVADERAMGVSNVRAYHGVRVLIGSGDPGPGVTPTWNFSGITAPPSINPAPADTPNVPEPAGVKWEYILDVPSTIEFQSEWYSEDSTGELKDMHWKVWSATEARGYGLDATNDCEPDCAQGGWTLTPVLVVLSAPVHYSCITIYTHAVFWATASARLNSSIVSSSPVESLTTPSAPQAEVCRTG